MLRSFLTRSLTALAAAFAVAVAVPAPGLAQPAPTPVLGISSGIGFSTLTVGDTVNYRVTGVPRFGNCLTALIDMIAAAPIIGPSLIDTISGGSVDAAALIQKLIDSDVIAAPPQLRLARDGEISDSFRGVPVGVYAVATVCNLNRDLYGVTGAFVLGSGSASGSNENGGSSFGSAQIPG